MIFRYWSRFRRPHAPALQELAEHAPASGVLSSCDRLATKSLFRLESLRSRAAATRTTVSPTSTTSHEVPTSASSSERRRATAAVSSAALTSVTLTCHL
jgi:hypothetical protein